MGRPTIQDLRDRDGKPANSLRNLVRHYVITKASGAVWKLLGLIDGDGNKEREDAPIFPGIGIWARPPSSGAPEAIVNMVGAATGNPAIVAMRDEKTRAALDAALGGLKEDETAVFNSSAVVVLKVDGTIEIRSWNGTAQRLVTESDFNAFRSWVLTHAHLGVTTGAGTSGAPSTVAPSGTFTQKLKGQ